MGEPAETQIDLRSGRTSLAKPDVPTLPDQQFVVHPGGVVDDVSAWLWSLNQGPDVSFSPDGSVRFFLKSQEPSAEGVTIGEWWDRDVQWIGHLEDSSAGYRVYQGRRYSAEEWVALGQPVPWASLALDRNTFSAGRRLWLPRRCRTGQVFTYVTDIRWTSGWVQPNITIQIRVDVGHGVIHGRPVQVRGVYHPDPNAGVSTQETNYYGPPDGQNAWVAHAPGLDPWSA
jgi:hypothetical protein